MDDIRILYKKKRNTESQVLTSYGDTGFFKILIDGLQVDIVLVHNSIGQYNSIKNTRNKNWLQPKNASKLPIPNG